MISASFGQNEFVTGGMLRVSSAPSKDSIPFRSARARKCLRFLSVRPNQPATRTSRLSFHPLALTPAPGVPVTDPNVAVIALPSNRDLYTIGIGMDALQLFSNFKAKPIHPVIQ